MVEEWCSAEGVVRCRRSGGVVCMDVWRYGCVCVCMGVGGMYVRRYVCFHCRDVGMHVCMYVLYV